MSRVIVYHSWYGCETGCCGHSVLVDPPEKDFDGNQYTGYDGKFYFEHPYSDELEDQIQFAKRLVEKQLGEKHVADLDWDHCLISDD